MSNAYAALLMAIAVIVGSHCIARSEDTANEVTASPWSMSVASYTEELNKVILKDTRGVHSADMKRCKKTGPEDYVCRFQDKAFNSSVTEFKRLNAMNGTFTQQLGVIINTKRGKLSRIQLLGNRGDPPNIFAFTGTIIDILQTFDPSIGKTDSDLKHISDELGLLRGDSADDIGKSRVMIEDWGAVQCLAQPSTETELETCVVEPRS